MTQRVLDRSVERIISSFNLQGSIPFLKEFYELRNENGRLFSEVYYDFFDPGDDLKSRLTEASDLYYWSLLITDKLLDEDYEGLEPDVLLLAYSLREQSLRTMYYLFPPDHTYWGYFDKYSREYINAVRLEYNNHFSKLTEFTFQEACTIYTGNAALAKAVTTALAFLCGKPELIGPFETSIDHFNIAKNLRDDSVDWKTDFSRERYSYIVTNIILKHNLEKDPGFPDPEIIGKYLYYSHELEHILDSVIGNYKLALDAIAPYGCKNWKNFIRMQIEESWSRKLISSFIVKKNLGEQGAAINEQRGTIDFSFRQYLNFSSEWVKMAETAVGYIARQWQSDFIEAACFQYFPGLDTTTQEGIGQTGDVFQRAVIAEALLGFNDLVNHQLAFILDSEAGYLVNARPGNGEGWSYFPGLSDQASDFDTTAQVLQVLFSSGYKSLAEQYCRKTFAFLMNIANEDGSFRTWIIPAENDRTIIHERQCAFFSDYCKLDILDNKDPEVIANMLYTLFLYNKIVYDQLIMTGIGFLEQVQSASGYWESSWYYGPLYGTYLCVRLMAHCKPGSLSLQRSLEYIASHQNPDGGWGVSPGESDSLNTAYALICLGYLRNISTENLDKYAKDALDYLLSARDGNHWPAVDFINMHKRKGSAFRSKTITTAFVLKAITLWNLRDIHLVPGNQ